MRTKIKVGSTELLLAAAGIYTTIIMLTNFCGSCWFTSDMYADAYLAEIMAREGTLFPQSWVFGNQFYVIATPAIAGLLCNFIGDGTLALRLASCIMTSAVLLLFYWCVRPFCTKRGMAAGLCCISGAVLIGQSFSTDLRTFQILYTMGSYYACYLIGILLCMGVYFRLDTGKGVNWAVITASCLLCFALGMQSLRETLRLFIPLSVMELWYCLIAKRRNKKRFVFVLLSCASNIWGLLLIKRINVNANPITETPTLVSACGEAFENLTDSLAQLMSLIGLDYLTKGTKWLPLGIAAVFILAVSVTALITIIIRKDSSPIAQICIFSWISILGVLAVGTLLMRTRNIYYFVWFFLAAMSFVYMTETITRGRSALLALLLLCAAGNCFYNLYPDAVKYREMSTFSRRVADSLVDRQISYVWQDFSTMPIIASSSKGKIISNVIELTGLPDQLFCSPATLMDKSAYENIDPERSRIIFAEADFMDGAITYIRTMASAEYKQELSEKLKLESVEECRYMTFYIYSFSDSSIIAG